MTALVVPDRPRPLGNEAAACAALLADLAVTALVEEAELTPKPALVDGRGPGAHADLDLAMMRRSAQALRTTFAALAGAAFGQRPGQALRERLGAVGRAGERVMRAATGGTNTHRGALWTLGLLVAGAAMSSARGSARRRAASAGAVARYRDRYAPAAPTNGSRVQECYGVPGARGEARQGFPHVIGVGLPRLRAARARGVPETFARLDALVAVMARLDDTCLLHRGGSDALAAARGGARAVLEAGGTSTPAGWRALRRLDAELLARNASPGGSADLLAATLFLDRLGQAVPPDGPPAPYRGGDPLWND
jgi:triphosphoribosyl-dephospho-CoA synthase